MTAKTRETGAAKKKSIHIASGSESYGSVNMCVPVLRKRKAPEISTLDDVDLDPHTQDDHSPQETRDEVSQALRIRTSPVSSPRGSSANSSMSLGMVGSLPDNRNLSFPMDFVQQLSWLEEAQGLSSSYCYEYLARAAVASILTYYDTPQGQPSSPDNFHGQNNQEFSHTSKDDNDRFCDAPEVDFNTSMAVFHYCVRNGYI